MPAAEGSREPGARVGLGGLLLSRGELETARAQFAAALSTNPQSVDARLGLADVATREGDRAAARRHLDEAIELDPVRADAHVRRQALTGPAPAGLARTLDEALGAAQAHPYDPRALLRAAELLERAGRREAAVEFLESAVWLADLDPAAATSAVRLLSNLSQGWSERRVVPVHVYADEPIRAREGWRFRMRTLWLAASNSLAPILEAYFVPVTLGTLRTAGLSGDLDEIQRAFARAMRPPPPEGILAAITGRPLPRGAAPRKNGLAHFLGRRLTARLEPDEVQSRVLAHELLHLYGAIHVLDDVNSLMNPNSTSFHLDRGSYRIVRAFHLRSFREGGPEVNLYPWIDLDETIEAYVDALKVNLTFRRLGIAAAFEVRELSRSQAQAIARRVRQLDPHLGDVAAMVANLMLADGRAAEALTLLEVSAKLRGRRTPEGRESRQRAEALRQTLVEKEQN